MVFDVPPEPLIEVFAKHECQLTYERHIHPANLNIPGIRIAKEKAEEYRKKQQGYDSAESDDPLEIDDVDTSGRKDAGNRESGKTAEKESAGKGSMDVFKPGMVRIQAIKKLGITLGAQEGYKWHYEHINATLNKNAKTLDGIFDFSHLITKDGVLYPVIERADNAMNIMGGGRAARMTKVVWRISEPARIIGGRPDWRQWLVAEPRVSIKDIPETMMPFDENEEKAWRESICEGFMMGSAQARIEFMDRLNDLTHDIRGMLRFRYLVDQGVVSEPVVVKGDLGVTYEEGKRKVNVGDSFIFIRKGAQFTPYTQWKGDIHQ